MALIPAKSEHNGISEEVGAGERSWCRGDIFSGSFLVLHQATLAHECDYKSSCGFRSGSSLHRILKLFVEIYFLDVCVLPVLPRRDMRNSLHSL